MDLYSVGAARALKNQYIYPFADGMTFISGGKDYSLAMKNGIKQIITTGFDYNPTYVYYLSVYRATNYFAPDYPQRWDIIIQRYDNATNTNVSVCSYLSGVNPEAPGVQKFSLTQIGTSGMSATVWIDWSKIPWNSTLTFSAGQSNIDLSRCTNFPYSNIIINVPTNQYAIIGETLELFYHDMVNTSTQMGIILDAPKGIDRGFRYEYTAQSGDTPFTATIKVLNPDGTIAKSKSFTITPTTKKSSPTTAKTFILVGDSLTEIGEITGCEYPTELLRLLTGTGGSPSGDALTNISFAGSVVFGGVHHEGHGGWSWASFLGSTSPFYNSSTSQIDFAYYKTSLGIANIDLMCILLGWNDLLYGNTITTIANNCKSLLNKIHTQMPATKVILMGPQPPCKYGGLGHDYNANGDKSHEPTFRNLVLQLNEVYKVIAATSPYSEFVKYNNIGIQFDAENNMRYSTSQVNLRNTATTKIGINGVHPAQTGFYQIADAVRRDIHGWFLT